MDFPNDIEVNSGNIEDEEELEEQRKRQEEIQNFVANNMPEFEYTDDSMLASTVGSDDESLHQGLTNGIAYKQNGLDLNALSQSLEYEERYKNAELDQQLQVLYDVRCREVEKLANQVLELETQLGKEKEGGKRALLLAEAECDRSKISLGQVQAILAEKVEEITKLNMDLSSCKGTIKTLQDNMSETVEEKRMLQHMNLELEQQLAMIERGFATANKEVHKEQEAMLRTNILQLEQSLHSALEQNEISEKNYKNNISELKAAIREKEKDILAKESTIGTLTTNLQNAQDRTAELLSVIENLSQTSKQTESGSFQDELRRLFSSDHKTEQLCETIRKGIIEQYENRITALNNENNSLKQNNNDEVYLKQISDLKNDKLELEKEIVGLKNLPDVSKRERSIQVSDDFHHLEQEKSKAEADLRNALQRLSDVSESLRSLEEANEELKMKINLEEDREKLITQLQQKAIEFETFIREKQNEEHQKEDVDEIVRVKYETALKEKELEIHRCYKEKFDARIKKVANIYSSPCKKCSDLEQKLNEMEDRASQDMLAVAHLVKTWQDKLDGLQSNFAREMESVLRSCEEEKGALSEQVSRLQQAAVAKDGGDCEKCVVLEAKVKNVQSQVAAVGQLVSDNWQLQLRNLNDKHNKEMEDAVKPYKEECASLVQKMALLQAVVNRNGKTFVEIKDVKEKLKECEVLKSNTIKTYLVLQSRFKAMQEKMSKSDQKVKDIFPQETPR